MYDLPSILSCPHCGRDASAIFRCPERKQGACPFVERWTGHKWGTAIALIIAGILMAFALAAAWPFWLGLVLAGLLGVSLVQVQLHNATTGAVLERTTLAGLQIRLLALAKSEPLSVRVEAVGTVKFPLSVLAFASQGQTNLTPRDRAPLILRAALLDLLTKGRLELHEVRCMMLHGRHAGQAYASDYFFAVPNPNVIDESGLGDIEKRLLRAAASSWPDSSPRLAWVGGRNTYNLVRQFYEFDRENPDAWVLGQAGEDSFCRGLSGSFSWADSAGSHTSNAVSEASASEWHAEFRSADDVSQRFAARYPKLWQRMYTDSRNAIASRLHVEDDGA